MDRICRIIVHNKQYQALPTVYCWMRRCPPCLSTPVPLQHRILSSGDEQAFSVRGAIRGVDGALAAPHVIIQADTAIGEQGEEDNLTFWPSIEETLPTLHTRTPPNSSRDGAARIPPLERYTCAPGTEPRHDRRVYVWAQSRLPKETH